jgi:flagella basal body P-ring formation protein FlgA
MTIRRAVLLAALALALPAEAAWALVTVRVAPEVSVQRDEVVLGDLGHIEGDEPLAGRLRQLRLGPAPLVGTTQRLDADTIRHRLRGAQVDLAKVQMVLPDRVVVTRAFQILSASAIVEAVRREALLRPGSRSGSSEGPERLAIVPAGRIDDLRIPTGEVAIDPRLHEGPPGSAFLAATIVVKVNGRDYQTLSTTFRIGRYQQVVVAARPLEPRTVLGPADFKIDSVASTELPADALASLAEPADLEVLRPVKAGEVITPRMVRQKITVKRGELVTVILEARGFRITTQGQATEDARRGDTVRVVNVTSKRDVLGKVEGPGIVRVPFLELRSDR